MPEFPIDIGFYESPTTPLAAQNCINHYPHNPQTKGALSQGVLFSTPGIEYWQSVGSGPGRGFNLFKNELYIVSGEGLYKVSSTGVITNLGYIPGSDRVIMVNNGVTLCIQIVYGNGYFYDEEEGLHRIVDPVYIEYQYDRGGVTSVATKDGYFIFTTEKEFFLSSLVVVNKGQDFDALDFATAEFKPDDIVLCATVRNELYIGGTQTIEVFQITGGTEFPYQRINGATIEKGVAARHSFIEFDRAFCFIGGNTRESLGIYRGVAGNIQKISTAAIDNVIQEYSEQDISEVFSWTYTEDGNFFVGFSFPDTTFVYDATTSTMQQRAVWHERRSNNTTWRVSHIINIYGGNYVLDTLNGNIGILKRTVNTEYSEEISREFTGGFLYNQGLSFKIPFLELKTESGVGIEDWKTKDENELDPQVELLISDDGGRNFVSHGSRSLGKFEEYYTRQVWKKLGRYSETALLRFKTSGKTTANYLKLNAITVGEG